MRRALQPLTWLLTALFLLTGICKLAAIPPAPENFARWGLPPAALYAVGAAETLGALGLLIPRTRVPAALGLAALMIGALRTGIVFGEWLHVALPAALLGLLTFVVLGERRKRLTP